MRNAGEKGAILTEEGARFLDSEGRLKAGVPVCPPEGDAGTGMVATDSVLKRPETSPQALPYLQCSSSKSHLTVFTRR